MAKTKKKRKKWFVKLFRILVFIVIVLAVTTLIINIHIKSYAKEYLREVSELQNIDADCIVVLGAGLWNETTPSLMLADRVLRGIELYENDASKKILMSGDHGKHSHDEVGVMRNYAIERGVSSEDIFLDHAGFSTYESMYRAKHIFGAQKIIIVTQKFHIERAVYIANKLGLEAYGVSSDIRDYGGTTYNEMRDILARVKDFFMVIFKPKPTYLGERISLKGNGEITLG